MLLTATGRVMVAAAIGTLSAADSAAQTSSKSTAKSSGFTLFARANGALTVNRVACSIRANGQICHDTTGFGFGAFWPRGTDNHYVFSAGFQIAGLVGGSAPQNPWAGDTTGGYFFNGTGVTHGQPVELIHSSADPEDLAAWPEAARVPDEATSSNPFRPLLRGQTSASQTDLWWLTWEGDPALNAERGHPLGVLLEQRGMGWNFPAGNEDVIYFVLTIYNITSTNPADYAGVRPALRTILLERAQQFQELNNAAFGISLPENGYPISDAYVAFGADMDIAAFGENYASVNLPFALGYIYDHRFAQEPGWTFDPAIFGPPFFPGSGIAGVKFLSGPKNPEGREIGVTNFSGYLGTSGPSGGAFTEPRTAGQLYRYLSGKLNPGAGDSQCNTGDPAVTHICFINQGLPGDMRMFQSTGPFSLPPGGSASIVVAIIFAAPVKIGSCDPPCSIRPGDPTTLGGASSVANGVNLIDSLTGYIGFEDANGDGRAEQDEFVVVPGSLLGKARVAQEVFNNGFLLPFAPDAPPFYLIPGDNQVAVLWQPSPSETTGDPFFASAATPTVPPAGGGTPVPNPLYDPSYRQFDVEGYRIYRGRVNSPNELTLVAQFDYAGTMIRDFQGQVNPVPGCAPELGIDRITVVGTDTTFGCPVPFDSLQPGVAPSVSIEVPLVGPLVQVRRGGRTPLATGDAIILSADTALTGSASSQAPAPELQDTGVPFSFLDTGVRSNLRYFYAVTAFDFNSFQSGPSTLESPRNTKEVTPQAPAANLRSAATLTQTIEGRGVIVSGDTVVPTIDPTTGIFSKRFPPANGAQIDFAGSFAQTVFSGAGAFQGTLIGLGLGDARNERPVTYAYEVISSTGVRDTVSLQVQQPAPTSSSGDTPASGRSGPFQAATADPDLLARFGVPAGFTQNGQITQQLPPYQRVLGFGRGCHGDNLFGGSCSYNGPRWFQGPNETKTDPNAGNVAGNGDATTNNNAGELPGVLTIQHPQSYTQVGADWRIIEAVLAGAIRAADFNLYWGSGGAVDSTIDLSHNVPVPFIAESLGAGWGFLNQVNTSSAASGDQSTGVLSLADFGCVFPLYDAGRTAAPLGCPAGVTYFLSATAVPGPIAIAGGGPVIVNPSPRPNAGFALYLAGEIFLFELAPPATLPAPGTVWTLRSYTGVVNGGNGDARAQGAYRFTPTVRPFTAVGAALKQSFSAANIIGATTEHDLRRVHTVPDPYYVTNQFETTSQSKVIQFVNLPADAIIRIYSSSGILVDLLEHHSTTLGGKETWNVRNRNNQVVASGVYFYHIESGDARRVGRFTVVNFAE